MALLGEIQEGEVRKEGKREEGRSGKGGYKKWEEGKKERRITSLSNRRGLRKGGGMEEERGRELYF